MYIDARDVGSGALLAQTTGLGSENVVAIASWTLGPPERNYSAIEQEC